jgi:enoyl-CoA hydratase
VAANLEVSVVLNSLDSPEQREFDRVASEEGLRAALAWRDARYRGGGLEDVEPGTS